jgi:hypothetical protein
LHCCFVVFAMYFVMFWGARFFNWCSG